MKKQHRDNPSEQYSQTTAVDRIVEIQKKMGAEFPRFAVFVIAYEAVTTLEQTLDRIPEDLIPAIDEIYVIDDFSQDDTYELGKHLARHSQWSSKLKVFQNPRNHGYGGNQKVGFQYAMESGFDYVILLHGDRQYAPEYLANLMEPVLLEDKQVVFGSRMLGKRDALAGGMPLYKFLGNIILTAIENTILNMSMSEFHSGYRLYSCDVLRQLPINDNTDDFHFDTQIIIQCSLAGVDIHEIAIPTYYGDEICRVNGMKYAFDVCKETMCFRLHQLHVRRFARYLVSTEGYQLKENRYSSHQQIARLIKEDSSVLELGCGRGSIAQLLARKDVQYTGVDVLAPDDVSSAVGSYYQHDLENVDGLPLDQQYDYVVLADVLEHLVHAPQLLARVREGLGANGRLVASTGNIAIWFYRISLLLGRFQYGGRGILDSTHVKLYTIGTFRSLLEQSGFEIVSARHTPIPFELVFSSRGKSFGVRCLTYAYQRCVAIWPQLFAFQVVYEAEVKAATLRINPVQSAHAEGLSVDDSGIRRAA